VWEYDGQPLRLIEAFGYTLRKLARVLTACDPIEDEVPKKPNVIVEQFVFVVYVIGINQEVGEIVVARKGVGVPRRIGWLDGPVGLRGIHGVRPKSMAILI
jgi:hypothetical protein